MKLSSVFGGALLALATAVQFPARSARRRPRPTR